jgi:hypothetical protein
MPYDFTACCGDDGLADFTLTVYLFICSCKSFEEEARRSKLFSTHKQYRNELSLSFLCVP